jgi:hypothetical protein
MKKITLILTIVFVWSNSIVFAQLNDSLKVENKKISIIPMPVLAANPTTGLIYGIAPGITWTNGSSENTSMSNFLGTLLYTSKKQLFFQVRGNTFLKGDSWILTTDIRYYLNSQPTYGLCSDPVFSDHTIVGSSQNVSDDLFNGPKENEMMSFNHFRFYQTILKRHEKTRFFYGLGYHLDLMTKIIDHELNLSSTPQILTYHYQYQNSKGLPIDKYTQSGLSLNLSFDSRDNVANPYSGMLAFASLRLNPTFLGSSSGSSNIWLEYRNYFKLNRARPRNMLAFWAYGNFVTGGKVPYMFLPASGWDMFGRSARPYTMGRFRGEDLAYTEAEWRFPLQKTKEKFGAVLFINMSTASNRTGNVSLFHYPQLGYGGGLRYMLSEKNRVNISLDYGFGRNGASGLFLNLNEMF